MGANITVFWQACNVDNCGCVFVSNFLILESIKTLDGFYSKIIKKPFNWENGYIIPSKEPGLGIELDEKIIKEYPYKGKELHLSVSEENIWN